MNDQEPLFTDGKDLPGFHSLLGYRQVSWEEDEAVLELGREAPGEGEAQH